MKKLIPVLLLIGAINAFSAEKVLVAKKDPITLTVSSEIGYQEFKVQLDNNSTDDYIVLGTGGSHADDWLPRVDIFLNKNIPSYDQFYDIGNCLFQEDEYKVVEKGKNGKTISGKDFDQVFVNVIDFDNDGINEITIEILEKDKEADNRWNTFVFLAIYDKTTKKYNITDTFTSFRSTNELLDIKKFGYVEYRGQNAKYYLYQKNGKFKEGKYSDVKKFM
jgi:hypothetical protein